MSNDLGNGLIAFYPFSGNPNNVVDHTHDGITSGGMSLTSDRHGTANSAYAFDGIDDFISLGDFDVPAMPQYSVSVWFMQDGGGSTEHGFGQKIIDKGNMQFKQRRF